MSAASSYAPELDRLQTGLEFALRTHDEPPPHIVILERRRAPQSSSFPADIVVCRLRGRGDVSLLCKYGVGHVESGFGHRGGVPYEARVYSHILRHIASLSMPYIGNYSDPESGAIWLILRYLPDAIRLSWASDATDALLGAARWIGGFHGQGDAILSDDETGYLNRYTHEYYAGWAARTRTYSACWVDQFPWIERLCERFHTVIPLLTETSPVVIHGEYYPKNILVDQGSIVPVDWESAAVAAGEIDIASLTEFWPPDLADQAEREYARSRWPDIAEPDIADPQFAARVTAARIYLHLRWLGNNPQYTAAPARSREWNELYRHAVLLDLV